METFRALLTDLERQLEERIRTVDAQCNQKVAAAEELAAQKLKELEKQHAKLHADAGES